MVALDRTLLGDRNHIRLSEGVRFHGRKNEVPGRQDGKTGDGKDEP